MKPYFTLTLLIGCVAVGRSEADCPYKECTCDSVRIICQNLNLTRVPALISDTAYQVFLYMDNNMITAIPAGSLPSNMTTISFLSNPITTIDAAAFDGSSATLTTLMFSGARFTKIPGAFFHLNALTDFSITDTAILDWNDEAMKHISQTLQTLILQNVSLTTWPSWTQFLTKLTELDIINSKISYIPDNALDGMSNTVKSFNLVKCNLAQVPKALSHLKAVQFMQLLQSEISDISWLPKSAQLTSLSLSNNSIRDARALSDGLRPYGKSLFMLDVVNNHLTSIPDLSFLTQVGTLDLSHNRIADSSLGNLSHSIYFLDMRNNFLPSIPHVYFYLPIISDMLLSYNAITQIRSNDFPGWTFVADLGHNLITELTDTSFPMYSNLTEITLNNNPITQISAQAFKGLTHLRVLGLQGTRLTRLPVALTSLVSLNSLDMTGNSYLVCTCLEKSLELSRILSNHMSILGNCGETSIYNFFVYLSPGCPTMKLFS
ncbi:hypothetical protein BsWGS_23827 [Bradybaena similaris]